MENTPKIPAHVAVIMDGNGRWATSRGLPRLEGHRRGVEAARRCVSEAGRLGIKTITLFAFSSENWARALDEVQGIMALLRHFLRSSLNELKEKGVRFRVIGDRGKLDADLQELIAKAEEETAENRALTLVLAVSYGGRDSIVRAVQAFAEDVAAGQHMPRNLTEDLFCTYLETADLPDPDLMIRPSGEQRISNYFLWEMAYTELVFQDVLWPDFSEAHLQAAVAEYGRRQRRFGREQAV